MRTEIENIICQEKENKRKKNQTTINDYPTTVNYHASLHMKEDLVAHLGRQRKANFGHQVASHAPFKWCGRQPFANTCQQLVSL
jgi:hypothetical protein